LDKEVSDLSLSRVECSVCGAVWMNGQHIWATGRLGDEETLSNLVCGYKNSMSCINPKHKKGHIYGDKDTWTKRAGNIKKLTEDLDDA